MRVKYRRSPSYGAGRYVGGILVPGERQSRAAPDCKNKKRELGNTEREPYKLKILHRNVEGLIREVIVIK